eukprot:8913492-Lingulodinium_polyedra.AAC.1
MVARVVVCEGNADEDGGHAAHVEVEDDPGVDMATSGCNVQATGAGDVGAVGTRVVRKHTVALDMSNLTSAPRVTFLTGTSIANWRCNVCAPVNDNPTSLPFLLLATIVSTSKSPL